MYLYTLLSCLLIFKHIKKNQNYKFFYFDFRALFSPNFMRKKLKLKLRNLNQVVSTRYLI